MQTASGAMESYNRPLFDMLLCRTMLESAAAACRMLAAHERRYQLTS